MLHVDKQIIHSLMKSIFMLLYVLNQNNRIKYSSWIIF